MTWFNRVWGFSMMMSARMLYGQQRFRVTRYRTQLVKPGVMTKPRVESLSNVTLSAPTVATGCSIM